MKKTLDYLRQKKRSGEKISVLTSYDYPTTLLMEEVGIDMIILGDSVGTNVLGYADETQVTIDDMIHHAKAVCRAKRNCYLVVDLPYRTYETPGDAVTNAQKLREIGADAIKFEGVKTDVLRALKDAGMHVMCHLGLNPQYDQERMKIGKVARGKTAAEAADLLQGALLLDKVGADLVILEKIPERVSAVITKNVAMPTIGIGAGKHCDGQVLIIHDLLGLNEKKFRHVPDYVNLRETALGAIRHYQRDVQGGEFPDGRHVNILKDEEFEAFRQWCLQNRMTV